MSQFRTILADPPWEYKCWGGSIGMRTAASHYVCQGTGWLVQLPVGELTAPDSTLLLWATNPLLPDAIQVVAGWGFTFKSMVTWVKMARAAAPRIGLGFHARACTEHLIIATKGKAPTPAVGKRPAGVIFCPRGEHSAKPSFQYDLAEGYPGPWLELFHRPREGGLFPPRPGWTFLGNEVDGRDIREALLDLARTRVEGLAQEVARV